MARKRSDFSASREAEGKLLSAPKRRKKVTDNESKEKKQTSKKSVVDSPVKSKTEVISEEEYFEQKSNRKRNSKKPVKKASEHEVKKPNIPVNEMNVEQLLALGENSHINDFSISSDNDFEGTDNDEDFDVKDFEESSDSETNDFEEVKYSKVNEPVIPKEGVDITVEAPNLFNKSKKRSLDLEVHLKRQLNRVRKDLQLLMHKVHVLCWIAHLRFVNNVCNDPAILKTCIELVKSKSLYPSKRTDLLYLEGILKWFHKTITFKKEFENSECTGGLLKELNYQLEHREAYSFRAFILMFIILLRTLGLKARIVISFQVLPVKPSLLELYGDVIKQRSEKLKQAKNEGSKNEVDQLNQEKKSQKNESCKTVNKKSVSPIVPIKSENTRKKKRSEKKDAKVERDNSDSEFESKHFKPSLKSQKKCKSNESDDPEKKNKGKGKLKKPPKKDNTVMTDSEEDNDFTFVSLQKKGVKKSCKKSVKENEEFQKKKEGIDIWTEVYLESEEKWISVDVPRQKIHCIAELYSRATHPVVYVIACNDNLTLKDVTKRYVPNWHSDTRKKRVDEEWWNETMKPYLPAKTAQDKEEDEDINQQLLDKPLPTSISEFKNHPLYALKRHLLKFEAIYPPDAPTLGFVRGEAVYARECVITLHSREMWYKQARVVRLKETPYKIVKARPKYDKMTGEIKKDLPLELFGKWQTEDYIPPIATGGKVPRNEYGNVDLFKPCMLPTGTVHLQIPGLIKIAKKLDIDCAPATVGFDFHSGGSHPVFDGFVVCEEFKDILLDAWNKEIDESTRKEEEKKDKRVYGNWKRLIRGLLIREKLKIKYAFGEQSDEEESVKSSDYSKPSSSEFYV